MQAGKSTGLVLGVGLDAGGHRVRNMFFGDDSKDLISLERYHFLLG